MKLKCFESTDSNGTEQYLIPLEDGSFIAVPKKRIEHSIDIVRCKECYMCDEEMWCSFYDSIMESDDYCSYGEREGE